MKPWILAGIALGSCLFSLGCDDRSPGASAAALEGSPWRLAAWSAPSLDPAGFEITADFDDGRISGRAAVNSYGGAYSASADGSFSASALAMTEMAGEPDAMRAESLYLGLLAQARHWRLADSQLVLSDDSQDLLIFQPR